MEGSEDGSSLGYFLQKKSYNMDSWLPTLRIVISEFLSVIACFHTSSFSLPGTIWGFGCKYFLHISQ